MNRLLTAIISFVVFSNYCIAQQESKPLTIGTTIPFFSNILNEEREINVYLPEEYHEGDTVHYPVIYVLDGGVNEDFLHIIGIVQFNTQPWIARFPRSIVVGIGGNKRRRDFTFAVKNTDFIETEGFQKSGFPQYGGSENFIGFIEKELQPFINQMCRTDGQNTVIGESLAGLFVTELLCKKPNLFDTYFIVSPSLWWGERTLLQDGNSLLKANLKRKANVYIGVPNKDEDVRMYQDAETLFNILHKNKNINVVFDYLPDELHSTVLHQAVYNGFKKLYSGND